jgi:hypothetical protein
MRLAGPIPAVRRWTKMAHSALRRCRRSMHRHPIFIIGAVPISGPFPVHGGPPIRTAPRGSSRGGIIGGIGGGGIGARRRRRSKRWSSPVVHLHPALAVVLITLAILVIVVVVVLEFMNDHSGKIPRNHTKVNRTRGRPTIAYRQDRTFVDPMPSPLPS